jgi:hypothetical protein
MRLGALAGAFDYIFCHLPVLLATRSADDKNKPLTELTLGELAAYPLVSAIASPDGGRNYISALTPPAVMELALQTTQSHYPTMVVCLHCLPALAMTRTLRVAHAIILFALSCCLYCMVSCKTSC